MILQNELLNEHEAARRLGISVATMRRRRLFRQSPAWVELGGRVLLFACFSRQHLYSHLATGRIWRDTSTPFPCDRLFRDVRADTGRTAAHIRRGENSANVFCAVEPKAGRHFTYATPDRSAVRFAQVVFDLAMQYPDARTIHLVMDNLNIHRRKSLTDLLGEEVGGQVWDRFTVHYTPTHGSWLNQAEIEIGILSRQCLGSRRIPDLKTLRREVRAWNRDINRRHTRINGTFDRKAARRQFGYKRKSIKRSEN